MKGPRLLLALGSVTFVVFGLWGLLEPRSLLAAIGAEALRVDAINDVRAVYGGLTLALAGFLAFCARDPGLLRPGLILQSAVFFGFAGGRGLSLVLDGVPSTTFVVAGLFELTGALLSVAALRRG